MNAQRQFILGIFFVVALSILAFYTLFLTDFTLFGDPIRITADFPEAHHLRTGDPVLVAGTRIGRVSEIEYRTDAPVNARIRVTMNLDRPIELLEGYSITIEESTFLGGRNINIDPGEPGGPPVAPTVEGTYAGVVEGSPIKALQEVGDLISDNAGTVSSFLASLDAILMEVREGHGIANRLIYDAELAADVKGAATDLRQSAGELRALTADARALVESVRRGEGTIGRLFADETLYQDFLATAQSLQTIAADLEAGKGVLGALLSDDDPLVQDVRTSISNFSRITAGLQAGEGLLGALLKDPTLAARVDGILTGFQSASEDLRGVASRLQTSEGTLGLLINDRELYDEARLALRLLTRSLEDYREAAPVSAFTSAVFGIF